jgi:hypothetical protein
MDLETRLIVPFMQVQLGVGLPSNGGSWEGRTLADVGLAYTARCGAVSSVEKVDHVGASSQMLEEGM